MSRRARAVEQASHAAPHVFRGCICSGSVHTLPSMARLYFVDFIRVHFNPRSKCIATSNKSSLLVASSSPDGCVIALQDLVLAGSFWLPLLCACGADVCGSQCRWGASVLLSCLRILYTHIVYNTLYIYTYLYEDL